MSGRLLLGDCLLVLPTLDAESVDAVVTDPPYGLGFMGKDWDHGIPGVHFWTEILRVAKPGAHLVAFGGTRTFHRLTCAIEDAGWEIRDCLSWLYGQGFPKSLNVAQAIDKAARGVPQGSTKGDPKRRGQGRLPERNALAVGGSDGGAPSGLRAEYGAFEPETEEAMRWSGWGTALKPAWEPIILARKPLIGSVAANVQKHGTGAINVDGCRIGVDPGYYYDRKGGTAFGQGAGPSVEVSAMSSPLGRWPANVVLSHTPECREVGTRKVRVKPNGGAHAATGAFPIQNTTPAGYASPDGTETVPAWECAPECPVAMLDEQSGDLGPAGVRVLKKDHEDKSQFGWGSKKAGPDFTFGDSGGASRFFYTAKASSWDRNDGLEGMPRIKGGSMSGVETRPDRPTNHPVRENHHPTVKPTDLMRWLVRLVTPPDGLVLDPFCGSGSTGVAAVAEGFRFLGIEKEGEYVKIAERRIANVAPLFSEGSL